MSPPNKNTGDALSERLKALPPHKRKLLEMRLREKEQARAEQRSARQESIEPAPRDGDLPLSPAQERLWFLDRLEPGNPFYNMPTTTFLEGELNAELLQRALQALVQRHETLRTSFVEREGRPVQVIAEALPFELRQVDLSNLDEGPRQRLAQALAASDVRRPFDLRRAPLLRALVVTVEPGRHALALTQHHIVSDGWSLGLLLGELVTLYSAFQAGQPSPFPPLPIQYADYAVWMRQTLSGESLEKLLGYWREQLASLPRTELLGDRPRPAVQTFRGGKRHHLVHPELVADLKQLAQKQGASPFMLLLSSFAVLLTRHIGEGDLVVGTPVANRPKKVLEQLIGVFINTLILRLDASGEPTFEQLLERVKDSALGAYAHQALPFEQLVEELSPERDLSRNPIFQILFNYANAPMGQFAAGELDRSGPDAAAPPTSGTPDSSSQALRMSGLDTGHVSSLFDISLEITDIPWGPGRVGMDVAWEYNSDLFDVSTVDRLAGRLRSLLQAAVEAPQTPISELAMLGKAEQHQVLAEWNDRRQSLPGLVLTSIEARVAEHRDRPALSCAGESWSYGQLWQRSEDLGRELRSYGVGAESLVAVGLRRGPDLLAALLAIWRAGGAYLPLDPDYPEDRLQFMMADSRARVLVTHSSLVRSLPDAQHVLTLDQEGNGQSGASAGIDLPGPCSNQQLAYVLYTSGSTGKPKGVQISHGSFANFIASMAEEPGLGADDALLAVTSLSFDIAGLELFLPLVRGARVEIAKEETTRDGHALRQVLQASGATVMQATPSTWRLLLDAGWRGESGAELPLKMLCGGEALPGELAQSLLAGGGELWNVYGPTETTVWSAVQRLSAGDPVLIGRPIANTSLVVVDRCGRAVPVGVPGELLIGGSGLARGYLGRPALSADRFLPDAFAQHGTAGSTGGRIYRTGDLVRSRADGRLDFLGRLDHQIKLRGFRIELGEIESRLVEAPGVRQAVAVLREDQPGDPQLVAYLVTEGSEELERESLVAGLSEHLPAYMVPSHFVYLDSMPLTPNRKVDRKALPAPERKSAAEHVPPRNEAEEQLAAIWREVLKIEQVGVHDSFFDLGGHSLLATQVISRVREGWGVELPFRVLFEAPTLGALCTRILSARAQGAVSTRPPLRARSSEEAADTVPLSFAQERLWFLCRIDPQNPFYNLPVGVTLGGPLDLRSLHLALQDLVQRHGSLRTYFGEAEGKPFQVVASQLALPMPVVDLSGLQQEQREQETQVLATADARRPFDLLQPPLFRAMVVRKEQHEHALLFSMHHLVADNWSFHIMFPELGTLYATRLESQASPLPELPVQYTDYAAWQRRWLSGDVLDQQIAYWRQQLASLPPFELPTDRPRPVLQTFRGSKRQHVVPIPLTSSLRQLAQEMGVPLFAVLLAGFDALLSRWTGEEDVVLGSPVAGRVDRATEGLIGLFVNTLVLRGDTSGNPTFRGLVERVQNVLVAAYDHQDLPFEQLVDALQPERDLARNPLFQIVFNFLNAPAGQTNLSGGATLSPLDADSGTALFDLTVQMSDQGEQLAGTWELNSDLFETSTVDRLAQSWARLLAQAVERPQTRLWDLSLLSDSEQAQLLGAGAPRSRFAVPSGAQGTLHGRFAQQVSLHPDRRALSFSVDAGNAVLGDNETGAGATAGAAASPTWQHWTYGELAARVALITEGLEQAGAGPGSLVAVSLDRSPELVASLLAVLASGAAYLPVDPAYPRERRDYLLADSGAKILIQQGSDYGGAQHGNGDQDGQLQSGIEVLAVESLLASNEADQTAPSSAAARPVPSQSPAYVIYTSGSTGQPKGVSVSHGNVLRLLDATVETFGFGPEEVWTLFHSYAFDFSVWELWGALAFGGRLVVVPQSVSRSPEHFAQLLRTERVTVLNQTPSAFRQLATVAEPPLDLRWVIFGGEALELESLRPWMQRFGDQPTLVNMYGITETTVHVTERVLSRADLEDPRGSLIGHPIADLGLHLLDRCGRLVPPGAPGEICVSGDGLARGYLGRPALTAQRFVPNPYGEQPGERLYRSGDLARRLVDGELVYLGRADQQVKIRGFRIELGEIEGQLLQHPELEQVAVLALPGPGGESRLVAYLVTEAGAEPSDEALREHLRRQLPEHMIPAAFVALEAMPLTHHGKLDRRALPAPEQQRLERREAYVAPSSELEQIIAEVWQEVLEVEQVGRSDNFFDLGGHSLLVLTVHAQLKEKLGRGDLQVTDLFRFPTVASLAEHLRDSAGSGKVAEVQGGKIRALRRQEAGQDERGIAVVGMAGRFPGAPDLDAFWQNLRQGVESISFFSDEELLEEGLPQALLDNPSYVKALGLMEDLDLFDARLFGYSPREAELMDPQQRIFLETAWAALEDAACDPERFQGAIGVYGGVGMSQYAFQLYANPQVLASAGQMALLIGNDKDFLATRVSYKLDLKGPSYDLQTACSTSLVATHVACQSLLAGECDVALAGGAALSGLSKGGYFYQEESILSPDGHCRAFDAQAKGTALGSGAGVVVLKRLADALADGDQIRAVIRGSAINNDGSEKVGYTAPSVQGQARVISEAQAVAGVEPSTIGYVELHGTGTTLGDPIEAAALSQVFAAPDGQAEQAEGERRTALGSVKTNIGHADAAAGVAGLIKTVLSVQHGEVLPSLHYQTPNPEIQLEQGSLFVNTELASWPQSGPRRAGVSAFGLGGTNAHVVLEQSPDRAASGPTRPWQLLTLSAGSQASLEGNRERLADWLEQHSEANLGDVAHTLQIGRRRLAERQVVLVQDPQDAVQQLRRPEPGRTFVASEKRTGRPVAFLFPGLGDHFPQMGRQLYDREPAFRAVIDQAAQHLGTRLGEDLLQLLFPGEAPAEPSGSQQPDLRRLLGRSQEAAPDLGPLAQTQLAQPSVFVVEMAMAALWREWGVEPQALIGYSLGEYAAACIAGVFSFEEGLDLVTARAQLIAELPEGQMLAVPLGEAELQSHLGPDLDVAAVNTPELTVVAGNPAAVEALEIRLAEAGLSTQRLSTRHAFHSRMMEPIAERFRQRVAAVKLQAPQVPVVSNVSGEWLSAEQATDPDYWVRHLRHTVHFAQGMEQLFQQEDTLLLEVGPGQALSTSVRQHPQRPEQQLAVASMPGPSESAGAQSFALSALGRLWLAGVDVDWPGFCQHENRHRLRLPTYAFDRQRYWVTGAAPQALPQSNKRSEVEQWFYLPQWRPAQPAPPVQELESRTWLLLGDSLGLARSLAAKLSGQGQDVVLVEPGSQYAGLQGNQARWSADRPEELVSLLRDLANAQRKPQHIVHLAGVDGGSLGSDPTVADHGGRPSNLASFQQHQARGLYSLVQLARAMAQAGITEALQLTVVADGLHGTPGGPPPMPEKSTLLGAMRVLPQEYRNIVCRSVDVLASELADQARQQRLCDNLLRELWPDPQSSVPRALEVALRGNRRMARHYAPQPLRPAEQSAPVLRRGGTYLITGAFGNVGRILAGHLARNYQAKLILTGRSSLPPEDQWQGLVQAAEAQGRSEQVSIQRLQHLLALRRAGAEVMAASVDVADSEAMSGLMDEAELRFGTLHGVFHLAAATSQPEELFISIEDTTPERCQVQLKPKVDGVYALERSLQHGGRGESLDFCLLFSSVASVLGGLGFTAYSASNLFLDAFAQDRSARGSFPWLAVNWDSWQVQTQAADEEPSAASVGQAAEAASGGGPGASVAELSMTPAEGMDALERALSLCSEPQVVVSVGDLDSRLAQWVRFQEDDKEQEGQSLTRHERPQLQTPFMPPSNPTEEAVASLWEELLGLAPVGVHDNFFELGGDSLLGTQLVSRLRQTLKLEVPLMMLFQAPTVAQLAAAAEKEQPQQEQRSEIEEALRRIKSMSSDDLATELRSKLQGVGGGNE